MHLQHPFADLNHYRNREQSGSNRDAQQPDEISRGRDGVPHVDWIHHVEGEGRPRAWSADHVQEAEDHHRDRGVHRRQDGDDLEVLLLALGSQVEVGTDSGFGQHLLEDLPLLVRELVEVVDAEGRYLRREARLNPVFEVGRDVVRVSQPAPQVAHAHDNNCGLGSGHPRQDGHDRGDDGGQESRDCEGLHRRHLPVGLLRRDLRGCNIDVNQVGNPEQPGQTWE